MKARTCGLLGTHVNEVQFSFVFLVQYSNFFNQRKVNISNSAPSSDKPYGNFSLRLFSKILTYLEIINSSSAKMRKYTPA